MARSCLSLLSARRAAHLIPAILKLPISLGFTATLQPLERSCGHTRTNALEVDVRDVSAEPQADPRAELLAKLERMQERG